MSMETLEITEDGLDALKELSTIGAGHAATALSQLVKSPIGITVPKVSLLLFDDVKSIIEDSDRTYVATILNALGEISGKLFLIFELQNALTTVDILFHLKKQTTNELDEKGQSAINEVGNIIVASFLNTLSNFLNVVILPSVPEIFIGKKDEIIKKIYSGDNVESKNSIMSSNALLFLSDKDGSKVDINTYLIWITSKKDVRLLLNKLHLKRDSIKSEL